MSVWLWANLGLGALFVLAIVGVPLWLVLKHPDTQPDFTELPGQRRAEEHRARQAAARQQAARQWRPRPATGREWNPAADN